MTAKSLVAITGATTILTLDTANQRFVAWTPGAPTDGFPIEGGKGYIVNVPQTRNFAFAGTQWTNQTEAAPAAPTPSTQMPQDAWAFVVSGHLEGKPTFDGYTVSVRNLPNEQSHHHFGARRLLRRSNRRLGAEERCASRGCH